MKHEQIVKNQLLSFEEPNRMVATFKKCHSGIAKSSFPVLS